MAHAMSPDAQDPEGPTPVQPLPSRRPSGLTSVLHGLTELPREVIVLAAVAFCVALGFGIVVPAIPVFAKSFGVSNFWASSVVSVFALMRFVSAFGGGFLVNRLGERLVLALGIGIVAVSSAMAGFAQSFPELLALRGIGGVGSAMFTVSALSLLLRVSAPEQRGQASGAFQSGFLIGGIAGPLLGGPLTEWSIRAPFFVYAVTLAAAGAVALVFLARTSLRDREQAVGSAHAPTAFRQAVRSSAYRAAVVNNFANGWSIFGVRAALIPIFVVEGLQVGAKWTGIGLTVGAVTQILVLVPAGRLADTRGRKPFLLSGAALGLVAAIVLAPSTSIPPYLVAMALFGAASALIGVSSAAVVGDVIGGRGGTPVAAYQMAADAGTFTGPLVAGALSDSFSFEAAFVATGAVSLVAVLTVLRMPETRPSGSAQAA
jgi:MFS family permease